MGSFHRGGTFGLWESPVGEFRAGKLHASKA